MDEHKTFMMRDIAIIGFSILLAVILVKTSAVSFLAGFFGDVWFVEAFVSGVFFISIFTAVPATAILVSLGESHSLWNVSLWGALGAMAGDLLLFRFVKDSFSDDIIFLLKKSGLWHTIPVFRKQYLRWLLPFFGILLIASPFPDEFGVALLGFSKIRAPLFLGISFIANFLGILAVLSLGKTLF